jgi:hypothetical protein
MEKKEGLFSYLKITAREKLKNEDIFFFYKFKNGKKKKNHSHT